MAGLAQPSLDPGSGWGSALLPEELENIARATGPKANNITIGTGGLQGEQQWERGRSRAAYCCTCRYCTIENGDTGTEQQNLYNQKLSGGRAPVYLLPCRVGRVRAVSLARTSESSKASRSARLGGLSGVVTALTRPSSLHKRN